MFHNYLQHVQFTWILIFLVASPETLLREDHKASRMIGLYSQLIGPDYVNNVISPFYRKLIQDTKDYEVISYFPWTSLLLSPSSLSFFFGHVFQIFY